MTAICNKELSKEKLKNILKQFKNVTKTPETFLTSQPIIAEQAKILLKEIYGISTNTAGNDHSDMVLPELVLDGMDEEQIWQQIELRNNSVWPKFLEKISKFLALKDEGFILNFVSENNLLDSKNEVISSEIASSASDESDEDEDETKVGSQRTMKDKRKSRTSVVDDEFFKLAEMENFLIQEDRREELRQKGKLKESEDSIDYFESISDEDEENVKYQEFFDNEERKNILTKSSNESIESESSNESEYGEEESMDDVAEDNAEVEEEEGVDGVDDEADEDEDEEYGEKFDSKEKPYTEEINDDDSSDEDDDSKRNRRLAEEKSSFEQKQERLKKRIEEHEEIILQEKPWQLKGEITATGRPQNSLLEEILEFDAAIRPAPVITEETTLRLEDIIKQRIKDKAWDDVERKYKPIQTPSDFRKKLVLDQEKSKESLAQIYEKEYHAQLAKLNPDNNDDVEEEPKEHKAIRDMMKSLFTKLDALSNFHYTPKPVVPEPKIITNIPAVNMEEVAPVAISDANLLAPEEIKNRPKGNIMGKSERQKTDKKRERRKKKLHQKTLYQKQEKKEAIKKELGLKPSKKEEKDKNLRNVIKHRNVQKAEVNSESTTYKSSKSFFSILQDKTTSTVKRGPTKSKNEGITPKKLKL